MGIDNIKTFVIKNWLGYLGIFIGILGIAVGITISYYFYKLSISIREPAFIIDPTRTEIIDSKHFSKTPLQVIKSDGSEIKGDITSVRFYFWNNGKQPIRATDILEPLTISLDEQNGEILDYKILKTSRKVVQVTINRDQTNPNRKLILSPVLLEQNDGFTGQLIFVGNPKATFSISGTIEGVQTFATNTTLIDKQFWGKYFKQLKYIPIFIGFMLIFFLLIFLSDMKIDENTRRIKKIIIRTTNVFLLLFAAVMFMGFLWGIIVSPIRKAEREARDSIMEVVPEKISPDRN